MKGKKAIAILLIFTISIVSLFAEGAKEAYKAQTAPEERVYVDSLGREVIIPLEIERVAPSGNVAQLAIYALAPEKMVGWSTKLSGDAKSMFLSEIAKLPVFGTFYGKKANLNKEALIAANPELVIDVGEIKGSKEAMTKQLDDLSKEIGIPVIFVEGYLTNSDKMFVMLGDILGCKDKANELALYTKKALTYAEDNKDKINKSVYYSSSNDGLSAIEKGSFHGEVIEFIGAENVVPSSFTNSNSSSSLENIYKWNPDVIILSNEDAYKTAKEDKAWAELKAVKNNEVYKIPSMPYSFIDSPPASNRIIGIYWLSSVLNPDSGIDINKEVKEYYSLFYHKDLSDSEVDAIIR